MLQLLRNHLDVSLYVENEDHNLQPLIRNLTNLACWPFLFYKRVEMHLAYSKCIQLCLFSIFFYIFKEDIISLEHHNCCAKA